MLLASTGSRAIVVGAAEYNDLRIPRVPSVERTSRDVAAALSSSCGMSPSRVDLILNPDSPRTIGSRLADASQQATDVLLFYYIGHGFVSPRGDLYLADRNTDKSPSHLPFSALPYSAVREAFHDSIARAMVVVLDCCFAGRALSTLSSAEDPSELAGISGAYVLAASAADELALAPEGEEHTAFSGELLKYLRDGEPDGARTLTLRSTYRHLCIKLASRGRPRPRRQSSEDIDSLILAANPATSGHLAVSTQAPQQSSPIMESRPPVRGKARVHELAEELGLSSKQVLSRLHDMGEYVKSPSSTLNPPVVRRLRQDVAAARRESSTTPAVVPPVVDADLLPLQSVLTGRVTGKDGPIPAAMVTLVRDGEVVARSWTTVEGKYRADGLMGGEYAMSVGAAGCEPTVETVVLPEKREVVVHHVELAPESSAMDRGIKTQVASATEVPQSHRTMGKARVHELAKDLGMSSKQVLDKLRGMGLFVRSPSSTIEAVVVRRLREEIQEDRRRGFLP